MIGTLIGTIISIHVNGIVICTRLVIFKVILGSSILRTSIVTRWRIVGYEIFTFFPTSIRYWSPFPTD